MDFSVIFSEIFKSETLFTGFAYFGSIILGTFAMFAIMLPRDLVEATSKNKSND